MIGKRSSLCAKGAGADAGQIVSHFHMHLIPWLKRDVAEPFGPLSLPSSGIRISTLGHDGHERALPFSQFMRGVRLVFQIVALHPVFRSGQGLGVLRRRRVAARPCSR